MLYRRLTGFHLADFALRRQVTLATIVADSGASHLPPFHARMHAKEPVSYGRSVGSLETCGALSSSSSAGEHRRNDPEPRSQNRSDRCRPKIGAARDQP
jgi:hypothetical protein